ncbi:MULTISPECIES: alpha/beta hydrolase [unclassified Pseudomonas]|uniref:alpha/beta hydrolase n=1 Tax=unclassified Pseudomonas TaxID=196821 RepID=UPI0008863E0A|nr:MULTISPECIES: dienelactone hydrolase family protein [unclassified Pseudomonas]SCZ06045.1 phospholipase/carboxylesterase [Pseudomonas sp. NFACC37-1]SFO82157.1 phospholipase/carboxylesterase [Pseudomonas sp. NFACC24-1]
MTNNPHLSMPVHFLGPSPKKVGVATILIHGRNQQPSDMFAMAERIGLDDMPYIALEAADKTWYPNRFMAPVADNSPWLDFALDSITSVLTTLEKMSIKREKIVLLGFSQGACLACEYVYRHASAYGGLVSLTGGLIGPEGMTWSTAADLSGTPVLMSNGDQDEWVPLQRTVETSAVFKEMRASNVQLNVFPDRPHLVSDEEIDSVRSLLQRLLAPQKINA